MNRRRFEALVEKAMRRLPKRFKDKIANIAVVVEDWADDETLADVRQLQDIIQSIREVKDVINVERVRGL